MKLNSVRSLWLRAKKERHRWCSVKKAFLEVSQNSQEKTCARVFFDKVAGLVVFLSTALLTEYLQATASKIRK